MIKIHEIRELIKLIDQSSIDEFEWENEGVQVTLKKPLLEVIEIEQPVDHEPSYQQAAVALEAQETAQESQPAEAAAAPAAEAQPVAIKSNWVGTFSASPKAGAASFVKVGDTVKEGQVVCRCYVDILKLSHDIESTVNGEIVDILVEDGQLIEYGQPLFLVKAV